jgi:SAM-dependent methyltransferase
MEMQREQTYFAATAAAETELDRLRDLEAMRDPATIRRFEDIGVTRGWRCVEIGAGGGSIARWLAARVGPTGKVVAADMDPRFLGPLSELDNVEVRRLDITTDDVEPETYDLVHCRCLLMHLDDPSAAIERMVAGLRPDGVLFVEDPDMAPRAAVDPDHPRVALNERVGGAVREGLASRGIFTMTFGRRLPGLLERAGLRHVDNECLVRINKAPSLGSRLARKTMSMFKHIALADGISEPEWDAFLEGFDDPTYEAISMMFVQAWGWR